MNITETDERLAMIEREMRQEDPVLVATFERLGSFGSDGDDGGKRLALLASAVALTVAVATMSPVAWVLTAVGLYAWRRS